MAVLLNRSYSPTRQSVYGYKPKAKPKPPPRYSPTSQSVYGYPQGAGATGGPQPSARPPTKVFIDRQTSGPMNLGAGGGVPGIGGDYGVQEMESLMNARIGRAKGDFTSQLRQMLIDLGVVDQSKLGNLGKYIDADTTTKAAQNKYSQTAQIAQQETAR